MTNESAQNLPKNARPSVDGDRPGLLILGLGLVVFLTLLSWAIEDLELLMAVVPFSQETAQILLLSAVVSILVAMLVYAVRRTTARDTRDIPREARPTGDGHFLYRFWGRDYILTPEQALRHDRPDLDADGYYILFVIAFAILFPAAALDIVIPLYAGGLVVFLAWWLGRYWRTRRLLDGCDYREVSGGKSMIARGVQWLEYNRSIYLRSYKSPIELSVCCLAAAGVFSYLLFSLWQQLSNHSGLEFVIDAVLGLLASSLWLGFSAVFFYALWRAIARDQTEPSGPHRPPGS